MSAWALLRPSTRRLYASYGLTALTIASGSYLIIINHSHMLQTCAVGLTFVAACLWGQRVARRKLAVADVPC